MILKTLPDFTGEGAQIQIDTTGLKSKIIQIYADSANSAPLRVGDSNTAANRGMPVIAGAAWQLPSISDPFEFWQLGSVYVYAALNDKFYVAYATEGSNS